MNADTERFPFRVLNLLDMASMLAASCSTTILSRLDPKFTKIDYPETG